MDDETEVLDVLRQQLMERFGGTFDYETAEDAYEAWEVLRDLEWEDYDRIFVVSDWLMPGVRGDSFLVDLHERYPETVKIMLTGKAHDDAIQNAFDNADLAAYVPKPWQPEELYGAIDRARNTAHY